MFLWRTERTNSLACFHDGGFCSVQVGRKEGKTEVSEGTPRNGLRVPVYSALLRSFYCPVVVAVFRGVLALSWSVWR